MKKNEAGKETAVSENEGPDFIENNNQEVPEQTETTPQAVEPEESQQPEAASENNADSLTADGNLSGLSTLEREMVEYVNGERVKAGLNPLQVDIQLSNVARVKSQDMVDNGYFAHNSPTYGSPFEMMRDFGIRYRAAGENIAKNSSVTAAHEALMNSEGHRANILNQNFTHIGIGIVDSGGIGGIIITQMFITR